MTETSNEFYHTRRAQRGGGDSNALFDSLKSERDELILDLWGVFRSMSDIKPPESMKLDDLELWTKVTEHRAVQDLLSNKAVDVS